MNKRLLGLSLRLSIIHKNPIVNKEQDSQVKELNPNNNSSDFLKCL